MTQQKNDRDYNLGYFEGKTFMRRATPRLPSRRELEDLSIAFSLTFDYDYEESWGILNRAYIAIFESYLDESGQIAKIACVCYETTRANFDHYAWGPSGCELITRAA